MNWFTGLMTFVIVWFVVLFTVLPWGVRPPEKPGEGHATSAPESHKIGRKALITTGLTVVFWVLIYLLIESDLISFRDWAARDWAEIL